MEHHPGLQVETVIIRTTGDRFVDTPLKEIMGKGVFVKEIEEALLEGRIDFAVHSMKDLPTETALGLAIVAVVEREDCRDAFIGREKGSLKDLPPGSKIGTGSLRRKVQILHHRPDVVVSPIRGNVDTRLRKMDQGEVDALVMAVAGLKRIQCEGRISEILEPDVCLNAVAQGALGLEAREGSDLSELVRFLHHGSTSTEVLAERAFLRRLGGGCQVPVGARGLVTGQRLRLLGVVGDPDNGRLVSESVEGDTEQAEQLGKELAERLLAAGAGEFLAPGRIDVGVGGVGSLQGAPLSGRRVVITRPRHQSAAFAQRIKRLGGQVLEFPTIEIAPPENYGPLDKAIAEVEKYDWIIFTSANGVERFIERFRRQREDLEILKPLRVVAIGPETARTLESHGLHVDLVPGEYRAEAILDHLEPGQIQGKRILLPRAAQAREVLPQTLREWGAEVDVVAAYRTVPTRSDPHELRSILARGEVDMVTFTSSSTVAHFMEFLGGKKGAGLMEKVAVACIGPISQRTAEEMGLRVDVVARDYTIQGLTEVIVEFFRRR